MARPSNSPRAIVVRPLKAITADRNSRPSTAKFSIYGICVGADADLTGPLPACDLDPEITVTRGPSDLCSGAAWYHHWRKPGGSFWLSAGRRPEGQYVLRFDDTDFAVSPDGSHIQYHARGRRQSSDSVRHYLLNVVLPMTMNLRGTEVLHASCILGPRGAVAFVGNGGYGKSSLAAAMVASGLPLLSDDAVPLLVLPLEIRTVSGAPEMNLFPRARRLLDLKANDSARRKSKVILADGRHRAGEFPLRTIYLLTPQKDTPGAAIRRMLRPEAAIELVRAAHRMDLTNVAMLRRQFVTLARVAELIEAKELTCRPGLPDLEQVATVLRADLNCE